jgi:hypothetical protein
MTRARGRKEDHRPAIVDPDSPEGQGYGESVRTAGAESPIPGGIQHLTNPQTMRQQVPVQEPRPEFRGMMAHGVPPEAHTPRERAENMRGPDDFRPIIPVFEKLPQIPKPVPVEIVTGGAKQLLTIATQFFTVPAAGTECIRISGKDLERSEIGLLVETAPGSVASPAVVTPAVPATTVAAQNTNPYAAQVVILANGATISAVTVNGINVGAAAGTYLVPAYGSIAISYTVATPTWTWSNPFPTTTAPTGIRVDHEIANLDSGRGALIKTGLSGYVFLECNDEMFAVSNDGSACTLSVIYLYGVTGAG